MDDPTPNSPAPTERMSIKVDRSLPPTVAVSGVSHWFGANDARKQVLFENNFVAHPGEVIIMTGPSGSGKTTLLTLIGALRSLQHGSLKVGGQEYLGMEGEQQVAMRHSIGFIFQAHNLFDSLTALENVRLATELVSAEQRAQNPRPEELLERLGLGERMHYRPGNLSGGQRQRVAVARALVNRPKLILADEPTAALDKESGRIVVNMVQELCRDHGTTALIVTHDARLLDLASRIVNMVDGTVVSDVDIAETQELLLLLHQVSVFKDLTPAVLKEVAGKLDHESFPEGHVIFKQGEAGDKFYIVRSGNVEIDIDDGVNTRMVANAGPGRFFGELALLREQPRAATVVATEPTEVLTLTKPEFLKLVQDAPSMEDQVRKLYFAG